MVIEVPNGLPATKWNDTGTIYVVTVCYTCTHVWHLTSWAVRKARVPMKESEHISCCSFRYSESDQSWNQTGASCTQAWKSKWAGVRGINDWYESCLKLSSLFRWSPRKTYQRQRVSIFRQDSIEDVCAICHLLTMCVFHQWNSHFHSGDACRFGKCVERGCCC